MLKDREEEYHAEEETEYQFSDQEASYDADQQAQVTDEGKSNPFAQLTRSKRMMISVGVFLALVFVVYKMVSPVASPDTSTDIVAAPPISLPKQTITKAAVVTAPAEAAPEPAAPPAQSAAVTPAQQMPPMPQEAPPTQMQPPVAAMPPVIPVQAPNQPYAAPNPPVVMQPASIDAQMMQMVATNAQHIQQLQEQYMQKMGGLESESKSVQNEITALNTRMATLESDLNKLTRTLTEKAPPAEPPAPPKAVPQAAAPVKINYSVQAIIPGRAWLRSANGDTVTVAEGDVLQGTGRIVKIDPYDGIVQIDVGSKVVSLSYGIGN